VKPDLYTKIVLTAIALLLAALLYKVSNGLNPPSTAGNPPTASATAGRATAAAVVARGPSPVEVGDKARAGSPSKRPAGESAPVSPVKESSVSQELQTAANRLRASILTKCGDATYLLRAETFKQEVIEVKNASMKVVPENLSEADRLNGIQLRGTAVITATAWRGGDQGWRDEWPWDVPSVPHAIAGYEVRKIDGEWHYGDTPYANFAHDHGMYTEFDLAKFASHLPCGR
jgi:hypothetical protein